MFGLGNNLNELKIRIKKAQDELAQIGSEEPLPELIDTTNLLRANEYLTKNNQGKTNLIVAYEEYTKKLEELVASLLSIQSDLKEIVQTEAALIKDAHRKKPRKIAKPRKKPKK
jgi:7,8-dihydro-6-hydroxymethylpterin-pyrophosphokinase